MHKDAIDSLPLLLQDIRTKTTVSSGSPSLPSRQTTSIFKELGHLRQQPTTMSPLRALRQSNSITDHPVTMNPNVGQVRARAWSGSLNSRACRAELGWAWGLPVALSEPLLPSTNTANPDATQDDDELSKSTNSTVFIMESLETQRLA